jgi:predicted nucleic acid-binding Zn ribbon protein
MGIAEDIKHALKLAKKTDNPELQQKLKYIQAEVTDLLEQLKNKEKTMARLRNALSSEDNFIFKDSAYYLTDAKHKITEGPFCRQCLENEQIKSLLVQVDSPIQCRIKCPTCNLTFDSYPIWDYLNERK